jgi:hypothetical protein
MLDNAFLAAQGVQFVGWIALFAMHWIGRRRAVLIARAVAGLLAVGYLAYFLPNLGEIPRDMGYSLAAIARSFETRELLLAGWIHYLVLDLFTGSWEAEHAEEAGVASGALAVCLFLTMIAGPLGLLAYLAAAGLARRRRGKAA